jgi:ssRNA-specific RNase YbeY (16S rRNA maturation enzyme)
MLNIISSSRYRINRPKVRQVVNEWLQETVYAGGYTVNIVFVGKNKMKTISNQYKKEPVALPVLAFPYRGERIGEEKILGEIFLCYPQVVLLAAERGKKVDDMIATLVKHGLENLVK